MIKERTRATSSFKQEEIKDGSNEKVYEWRKMIGERNRLKTKEKGIDGREEELMVRDDEVRGIVGGYGMILIYNWMNR